MEFREFVKMWEADTGLFGQNPVTGNTIRKGKAWHDSNLTEPGSSGVTAPPTRMKKMKKK